MGKLKYLMTATLFIFVTSKALAEELEPGHPVATCQVLTKNGFGIRSAALYAFNLDEGCPCYTRYTFYTSQAESITTEDVRAGRVQAVVSKFKTTLIGSEAVFDQDDYRESLAAITIPSGKNVKGRYLTHQYAGEELEMSCSTTW